MSLDVFSSYVLYRLSSICACVCVRVCVITITSPHFTEAQLTSLRKYRHSTRPQPLIVQRVTLCSHALKVLWEAPELITQSAVPHRTSATRRGVSQVTVARLPPLSGVHVAAGLYSCIRDRAAFQSHVLSR